MSLYLGKNSVGNSVLHTTRASVGESVMKAGVNESTTFHSSLPYVQLVERFTVPHYRTAIFNGQYYNYGFFIKLPDEAIGLVNSGYLFNIIVSTRNTGGQRVGGVIKRSSFSAQTGTSPSHGWSEPAYVWRSSTSSGASSSTTASTTYSYLDITRTDKVGVLYTGSHIVGPDEVYTAEIVFYNIINKNIVIENSVNEIILSPSEFSIKTSTSNLDMAKFSPVKVSSSATATSFITEGGSVYIEPIGSLIKPVKGWILDSSNSNNCIIQKVLTDNTIETIVSNSTKNMIYIGSSEYSYSVSAQGSLGSSPGLFTIAQDEMAIVFTKGTFSNSVIGTVASDGATTFIGNSDGSYVLSKGGTVHVDNGSYSCDAYTSYLSLVSGVAYLMNEAYKYCSGSAIRGTFAGTMKVLKFKIV